MAENRRKRKNKTITIDSLKENLTEYSKKRTLDMFWFHSELISVFLIKNETFSKIN